MYSKLAASLTTTANSGTNSNGMYVYYIIIALMFVAMYFFTIRPQNKKEKELKNLRDNLQVGDEVMSIGGIYGTVVRIKDDIVTVASGAEKTKIDFNKSAINTVLNREIPAPGKEAKEPAKKIKRLNGKEEVSEQSVEE